MGALNVEDPSFLEEHAEVLDRLIAVISAEPPPPELEAQVRELLALLRAESDHDRRLFAALRGEGPYPEEISSQEPPNVGLECSV